MSEENHYHYVTWSGGGAKGGGYGGSYTALKKSGAFDHVKTVAGSSAGAMSAILAASGATPEKLQQVTESMDFQALLGDRVDGSMVTRSGTPLYEFLKAQVKENISVFFSMHHRTEHSPDIDAIIGKSQEPGACITFADLAILNKHYPKTFKRAIVTAVVKSTGKLHIFNASNDPDVDVALAAKASAALPIILESVIIKQKASLSENEEEEEIEVEYIDGGYADNTPTSYFKQSDAHPEDDTTDKTRKRTLVFVLGEGRSNAQDSLHRMIHDGEQYRPGYMQRLTCDVLAKRQVAGHYVHTQATEALYTKLHSHHKNHTVIIRTGNVKMRDFKKAKTKSREMFYRAYCSTQAHLIQRGAAATDISYQLTRVFFNTFLTAVDLANRALTTMFSYTENANTKMSSLLDFCDKARAITSNTKPEEIESLVKHFIYLCCFSRSRGILSTNTRSLKSLIISLNQAQDSDQMKGVFAKLLNKNPNHDFQESDFKELTKNAPSCFRYATDELSFYQNIREPKTRARIRHQSYGGFFNTADQRIIEDITPSPDFQM